MRIMGIDFGGRRIGVAVSDEEGVIAFPHVVVDSKDSLKAEFSKVIERYGVKLAVIGNPLDMSGEEGAMSKKARTFAERLAGWFDLEYVMWDERYTSQQADGAARKSGSHEEKGHRDMAAATIILQSYLDAENRNKGT